MTSAQHHEHRTARAHGVAARLLAGAHGLQLVPYRRAEQAALTVVATGFLATIPDSTETTLVVALDPADASVVSAEDVRLDLTYRAPHLSQPVVVASLHGLGTLRPLGNMHHGAIGATSIVGAAAHVADGTTLFTLDLEKLLLHDGAGVHPLDVPEVLRHCTDTGTTGLFETQLRLEELSQRYDQQLLATLADAAERGALMGSIGAPTPLPEQMCGNRKEIFVLDVDEHGVSLLRLANGTSQSFWLAFDAATADPVAGFADLLAQSILADSTEWLAFQHA